MKNSIFIGLIALLVLSIFGNIYLLKDLRKDKTINSINNGEVSKKLDFGGDLDSIIVKSYNEKKNIFQASYDAFNKINSDKEFKEWKKIYSAKTFLIAMVKKQDEKAWINYYSYLYNYYSEIEGGNFGKDFKQDSNFNKSENLKENFLLYIKEFYNNLVSGKKIIATKENIENDLNITFASNDLSEIKKLCSYRAENIDSSMPTFSCIDDNYLYKATKENGYCEKISDFYKQRLCEEVLEYIGNK